VTDHVAFIKEINQRIVAHLDIKRGELRAEIQDAQQRVESLMRSLNLIDAKQAQLEAAEELQIALLQSSDRSNLNVNPILEDEMDEDEDDITHGIIKEKGKLKARIGDQRYMVLLVPRHFGSSTLPFIIFRSTLPEKRVREAVNADLALGVLEKGPQTSSGEDSYRLSDVGMDLMQRFEDYRRSKNLPLQQLPEVDEAGRLAVAESQMDTAPQPVGEGAVPSRPGTVWEMIATQ
jgi:hypothetical protein